MPARIKKICPHLNCNNLTRDKYCDDHKGDDDKRERHRKKAYDTTRPNSYRRGYDRNWQAARLTYLTANPLCVSCESKGVITVATEVDHISPHKGDKVLFWDAGNWQGLCKPCHSSKTAHDDSRFLNRF